MGGRRGCLVKKWPRNEGRRKKEGGGGGRWGGGGNWRIAKRLRSRSCVVRSMGTYLEQRQCAIGDRCLLETARVRAFFFFFFLFRPYCMHYVSLY